MCRHKTLKQVFLSTPSARRATQSRPIRLSGCPYFYPRPPRGGRPSQGPTAEPFEDFYPRPPRGGRHVLPVWCRLWGLFLSTPSARRATFRPFRSLDCRSIFLSTPSARRATPTVQCTFCVATISIHALREEGDSGIVVNKFDVTDFYPRPPRGGRPLSGGSLPRSLQFLSTPSARRATQRKSR